MGRVHRVRSALNMYKHAGQTDLCPHVLRRAADAGTSEHMPPNPGLSSGSGAFAAVVLDSRHDAQAEIGA